MSKKMNKIFDAALNKFAAKSKLPEAYGTDTTPEGPFHVSLHNDMGKEVARFTSLEDLGAFIRAVVREATEKEDGND